MDEREPRRTEATNPNIDAARPPEEDQANTRDAMDETSGTHAMRNRCQSVPWVA